MAFIQKAPETMTSRERVRRTFAHEKTDRVTIGYEANAQIHKRLCEALGISPSDWRSLYRALGVDYRQISAPYTGPALFQAPEGRRVDPLEGFVMRWVANDSGGYWDFCDFPLQDAEDEDFDNFPIPDPDNFDYDAALENCRDNPEQLALYIGHPGVGDIINTNGRMMGMEDALCHLLTEYEPAMNYIRRKAAFHLGCLERLLDKCRGHIDFVWLGEDLGTQHKPMISLEMYRRVLRPIHQQFVDLAKSYDLPSMFHTCGSSSWVYNDFIEMGVTGVDTLQPEATNMSPRYLAETFGSKLCYRGCISTAGPLAYGTAEEVVTQVKDTLAVMMPLGGYHFAPTHMIQDNSPTENVIAMYQAAHNYGRYE